MCLTVKENTKIKVAKKNIKVYKYFELLMGGLLVSPFQCFKYTLGTEYSLGKNLHIGEYGVKEGFHSYPKKSETKEYGFKYVGNLHRIAVLIPCIIPKGSKYIEGTSFELNHHRSKNVVSDTLILPKTFTYEGVTYYTNKSGSVVPRKKKNQ